MLLTDGNADDGVTMAVTNTVDTTDDTLNFHANRHIESYKQISRKVIDSLDASTYETINITANAVPTALGMVTAKTRSLRLQQHCRYRLVTVDGSRCIQHCR